MANSVQGYGRWMRQIAAIPQRCRENLRAVNEQGVTDMAESMRAHVPVLGKSHKDRTIGELRSSIGSCAGLPPTYKGEVTDHAQASIDAGLRFSVYAGGGKAFYGLPVETGRKGAEGHQTRGHRKTLSGGVTQGRHTRAVTAAPAHPFFGPIVRLFRGRIRNRQSVAVRNGLKEAAATS